GANPTDGHPVFASRMKRRLRGQDGRPGAKLIVIDPRRTDIVRSPHIEAQHHLPLRPGTNVAVLSAMAHVIVTEGLTDEAFIRERCDWDEYSHWAEFVSQARNSPENLQPVTLVDAEELRAAARLYATGGNGAIYYGLGVTEHSQGSSTVMAIANLAMATGNIGRRGVGVNPLRGQNNVQGACDMGSFPHELAGYRHISDGDARRLFEDDWGVTLDPEPGLRIPSMLDAAVDGVFKALYCQGEDILQSDPNTAHVSAGLAAMECVIVHDLFLNETANYAHIFLPGSTFLEKNGTFTNAERRIQPVRKVMTPLNGLEDWEVTQRLAQAMGLDWNYSHPSEIMDEIARLTPTFAGVSFARLDEATTGRILSQYNVGAQTRRTENVAWHPEDLLEIHPVDAEDRGLKSGDWVKLASRAGETTLRATVTDRVAPGVVYTTFHHAVTQANVVTTDFSDWATNCPEYKVTAVQISASNGPTEWQEEYEALSTRSRRVEAGIPAE
ncbi:MAG: molybdopterin-dependent oxidoreductase, partial [Sphingomonadales bacterium]|nr:molybdopterin-dependent oxidoreductase [Sphingomonadales bacterium]